ncbi:MULTISPECIES: AbgT family transporter [unclassified Ensifer]|uniref:AbgT family transporter n=1 Tax=unclassified Ensifer TaxID=2633371 RepID=UPI00244EAADF|nr:MULTISPECIES: AbgT family transporter [unclassified Ensifer]
MDPATGQAVAKTVAIENILTPSYFANLIVEFPKLLVGFPPIALTLIVMMGISVAEHSGFLSSVIRGLLRRVPKFAIISFVSFVAINGDLFGDAAMFVLMPLAATLFYQMRLNLCLGWSSSATPPVFPPRSSSIRRIRCSRASPQAFCRQRRRRPPRQS